MPRKDFRIPKSAVTGLDDADYYWALIERVWPDMSVKNELKHVANATPGQCALYVVTLCLREIDNGGLNQFFCNPSGMYADEVRKAFRLLGADEHAAAFEKALRIFPESRVPVDQEDRQDLLEMIPKSRRKALFEPLEEELFGEYHIYPYFERYVEMHPSEFFVDVQQRSGGPSRRRS